MSFEKIEYIFPKIDINIKIEDVLQEPVFSIPTIKELNRAIIKNLKKENRIKMNINSSINKILTVLANKGKLYKYNTFKFYSENNCKYSTKHQLLEKHNKLDKYNVVKESYSNRDILTYLMKEYKGMR